MNARDLVATVYLTVAVLIAGVAIYVAVRPQDQPDPLTTEHLLEHLADTHVLDSGTRVTIRDGRAHAADADTTLDTAVTGDILEGTYTLVSGTDGHTLVLIRADDIPEEG